MKRCPMCKIEKPLFAFSPDARTATGVQSRCKTCQRTIAQLARDKDPQKHRDAVKKTTQKHYAEKLQRNREYRIANADKVRKWKATDRQRNKSRILADNA